MKNNNNIGQELSEFTLAEIVGYEVDEAGNADALASRVVHEEKIKEFCNRVESKVLWSN